jgi:hypothetical protein
MCDWITPNASTSNLTDVKPGSETGTANGLTLFLDAETSDYGAQSKYVYRGFPIKFRGCEPIKKLF